MPCANPVSSTHSPWKAPVRPARRESCRARGRRRLIPTGNPCSRSATRIPSRMVVAFPSLEGIFSTTDRPRRRLPPVHNSAGNQTGSPRSVMVIGTVPLAVERAGTAADLPCETAVPAHQSMVFLNGVPSHVSDDVCPGAAVHCVGIFMRGCLVANLADGWRSANRLAHGGGNAQPIALRMAAISAQ